jgi:hypothetical protein
MRTIAGWFYDKEYTLRSGGATGADLAFELGAGNKKEILFKKDAIDKDNAMRIAKKYHDAWYMCGNSARLLHTRNVLQVMGPDMITPVDLVICWTNDSCISHRSRSIKTGGTGTAISVASTMGIPVFNLASHDSRVGLLEWMGIELVGE